MTSTITTKQQQAIIDFLKGKHIPSGLGNRDEACSIAAINLALTGQLTDAIPDCMSRVIGRWIICIQDQMPDDMRNSQEWRALLPLAAGTGRKRERERLTIILDWMWVNILPQLTSVAETYGFGDAWKTMLHERTENAAEAAAEAAAKAAAGAAESAIYATEIATYAAAKAATYAADAATKAATYAAEVATYAAAKAATYATEIATYAAEVAAESAEVAEVAEVATYAAAEAAEAAAEAAADAYWRSVDPVGLLHKLVA